jgi:hypothetical protein
MRRDEEREEWDKRGERGWNEVIEESLYYSTGMFGAQVHHQNPDNTPDR